MKEGKVTRFVVLGLHIMSIFMCGQEYVSSIFTDALPVPQKSKVSIEDTWEHTPGNRSLMQTLFSISMMVTFMQNYCKGLPGVQM